jgi:hypothetical protein
MLHKFTRVFVYSTSRSCQIFLKIELFPQISEKSSNIRIHDIPSSGDRVASLRTADTERDGRKDVDAKRKTGIMRI